MITIHTAPAIRGRTDRTIPDVPDIGKHATQQTTKRRRRHPDERRRMILSVALDFFAKNHYESVTIRDIAAACDINIALIYYYFNSKKGLFRAAIESSTREALGELERLRGRSDDPVALIDGWFEINVDVYPVLVKLVKITVDYAYSDARDGDIDELISDLYRRETELLAECFEKGIEGGLFRKVDTREMALFVSVQLDGIFLASMIRPDTDVTDLIANLRDVLWQQLRYQPPRISKLSAVAK
ncbi:MAG: TetR/AcrR family transcriptional regulator [Proteobacteria bacterium]|nr:MAG: TetR/AcrR family transcriptional regulator [Pseudomonadota bacterium]